LPGAVDEDGAVDALRDRRVPPLHSHGDQRRFAGQQFRGLTAAVDPAPPEAPDERPVMAALYPRNHERTPGEVLDEEAFDWIRPTELLVDAECGRPGVVGVTTIDPGRGDGAGPSRDL
jgi:hypothetical protein